MPAPMVGMGATFGQRRLRTRQADGGVRSGPRLPDPVREATRGPDTSVMEDTSRAAQQTGAAAQSARGGWGASAGAGQGGGQDPYRSASGPSPQPGEQAEEKPGKLPGGHMGLKPDFSAVEAKEKEYADWLRNSPSWTSGFMGVAQIKAEKASKYEREIAMLKEQAYRNVAVAEAERAANEYVPVPGAVKESGQLIKRRARDGHEIPWTMQEKETGPEGPWAPDDPSYREVTKRVVDTPVYNPQFPHTRLQGENTRENTRLTHTNKMAEEAEKSRLEREEAEIALQNQLKADAARAAEARKTASHTASLPAREQPTTERQQSPWAAAEEVAKAYKAIYGEAAWENLPDEKRNKILADATGGGEPDEPAVGTIEDGPGGVPYRYVGGNPGGGANPKNWQIDTVRTRPGKAR